jgi:hypothetical protein
VIRFTSDQGIILPGPGSRYRLLVAVDGADGPEEPVRWQSSDPAAVSVRQDGTVTAHAATGSATITVMAAHARPQAAQVLIARPAADTVLVPTADVLATRSASVRLRSTARTAALRAGEILVSNGRAGGGLLATVVSASVRGTTVVVTTRPASLPSAFPSLSVTAMSAPVTTVPGTVIRTTAAQTVDCTTDRGSDVSLSLDGPGISVPATVQLVAVLNSQLGVVHRFQLAVRATLPVIVTTGGVSISAAGHASATCDLDVPSISAPTPVFLGPVEITADATPRAGVDATANAAASLTLAGPTVSQTTYAFDGIAYTASSGWRSLHQNSTDPVAITQGKTLYEASVNAALSPFLRVDFGVGAETAGDELAGAELSFAQAKANYGLSIQSPLGRFTPSYTGPLWDADLELTDGVEANLTGDLVVLC